MQAEDVKNFYKGYADKIVAKRWQSKYPLRSYAHEAQYASFLPHIQKGMTVLDAGCGEGILSLMMAERGAIVTGVDLSLPNIEVCNKRAKEKNLEKLVTFVVGDAEQLLFEDESFDVVVSSHVLEHLPDFDKGLSEIVRVTKARAIIAIPTACNLCSMVQVGGGWFYLKGPRSFAALPIGFAKVVAAYIFHKEGVNESYGGHEVPHVFRFIHVMKKRIRQANAKLISYEASSICLPYFSFLLPLIKLLDKYKKLRVLRNFGYGTTFIIERQN